MIRGIGQLALLTRDVERAAEFYGKVLELPHLFTFGTITFFDCGGTRLFIRQVSDEEWQPGLLFYLLVDDIQATHASLAERGVTFDEEPHLIHTHDDGVEDWMAFFKDPDGNNLALMSRVSSRS